MLGLSSSDSIPQFKLGRVLDIVWLSRMRILWDDKEIRLTVVAMMDNSALSRDTCKIMPHLIETIDIYGFQVSKF